MEVEGEERGSTGPRAVAGLVKDPGPLPVARFSLPTLPPQPTMSQRIVLNPRGRKKM